MSEEYNQDEQEGGEGVNVRFDDFVARIVEDPNQPPDLLLLSGYLGASSEEGHVRLYLDEELSQYVEIPQNSIRHTQEIPPDQSPLGGSMIWIDRGAEVLHGKAGAERRKATFLEGQIAQDFIGAVDAGAAAQPKTEALNCQSQFAHQCILPTDSGPKCISQFGPCIPPTEVGPRCNTRTGILCTRVGPNCRTVFDPVCTQFGPKCQSVAFPCFTRSNQPICQISQVAFCGDTQICEQASAACPVDAAGAQQFAAQAALVGGFGGAGGGGIGVGQTGFNCPSLFDNCATQDSFCPSQFILCTQYFLCVTSNLHQGPVVSVDIPCQTKDYPCPSVNAPCPTRSGIRCGSQVAVCPHTRADCIGNARAAQPQADAIAPPQQTLLGCVPSQFVRCPSAVDACPTRINCPSVNVACQSQLIRCQSAIDACPTRFNCPSVNVPCQTRFGRCETFGACPSAVDACPTRFGCESLAGCFETQNCGVSQACGVSQGCFPGGGGFGGGGF